VRHGLPSPELDRSAVELLVAQAWPGNIRELLNLVERIAILHPGARWARPS
jgi:DNA-binding NtrC family response regulator